jgi:membrane protein YdbS with pleckstrin-like domain
MTTGNESDPPLSTVIRCPTATLAVARAATALGCVVTVSICVALCVVVPLSWVRLCLTSVSALVLLWSIVEYLVILPVAVRHFSVVIVGPDLIIHRGSFISRTDRVRIAKVTSVRTRTGPFLRRRRLVQCTIITPAGEFALPALAEGDTVVFDRHRTAP